LKLIQYDHLKPLQMQSHYKVLCLQSEGLGE
jgi:hypothetical protein